MTKIKEVSSDGLEHNKVSFTQFGRFFINLNALNKNTLIVRYKSGAGVPTIPKQNVTNEFKLLVSGLFDTKKVDYNIGAKLSKTEKDLFFNLMKRSGLSQQFDLKPSLIEFSDDDLKTQFKILQGEIIAGNSNNEILSNAINIIEKLKERDIITSNQATELIQELQDNLE